MTAGTSGVGLDRLPRPLDHRSVLERRDADRLDPDSGDEVQCDPHLVDSLGTVPWLPACRRRPPRAGWHTLLQPWAIVDPYWPAPNPFVAGGGIGYRFHNATLLMPVLPTTPPLPAGELFCAGQRWTADGRLSFAGGTRVYPWAGPAFPANVPPNNTGNASLYEGAKLVYQWDPTTSGGNPFGQWFRMADLEVERWYPTVSTDGSMSDRMLILGGTDWDGVSPPPMMELNTYESYRTTFGWPVPLATFEVKTAIPTPAPTARQYNGQTFFIPPPFGPVTAPYFTDYPRVHALGVLDPISGGQTALRQFMSGWWGQGFRWAHDPTTNPTYYVDVGQEVVQSRINYCTNMLMPGPAGQITTRIARIGGARFVATGGGATNRVETVLAGAGPAFWSSGTVNDVPDMLFARNEANVVILPTGALFAVGGDNAAGTPQSTPEVLAEGASTWRVVATPAAPASPRNYHACAVLMPDARVFVCGADARTSD